MNIKLPFFPAHCEIKLNSYIFATFLLIGLFLPLSLTAQEMGLPAGPIKTVLSPADSNDIIKRWTAQRNRAAEDRNEPVGKDAADVNIPVELSELSGGEKAKIAELYKKGQINVPMDFVALAKMRASGKLVTVDMASDTYFLDVGGSSSSGEFTTFSFGKGDVPVKQDSPDYAVLSDQINFLDGKKIDLMEATG